MPNYVHSIREYVFSKISEDLQLDAFSNNSEGSGQSSFYDREMV
jgi:hypothetical protein